MEQHSQAEFLSEAWPVLYRVARLRGASHAESEDAAQSAIEKALRHWSKVVEARDPLAYLVKIMLNVLRYSRRSRKFLESVVHAVPDEHVASFEAQSDTSIDVMTLLKGLPPEQRDVIILRYYLDFPIDTTADTLNIPTGTAKSRGSRALAALGVFVNSEESDRLWEEAGR